MYLYSSTLRQVGIDESAMVKAAMGKELETHSSSAPSELSQLQKEY
jgi:hypothetical protein